MDKDYDSNDRECFSCFYDLHLSAVSCQCTPNRFACLNHMNLLCSCGMDRKITLFRYSMEELNTLVAALEGDPAAVCCWGQDHLGLVCQSGSLKHRKMDSCKSTEFSGLAIDANLVSGFGGNQNQCDDLQKPAGFQQGKGVQNNCLNLNIEDPPCSSRIKEPSRHQVEPLDYGMVMIGKKWFNNQAIFPKGNKVVQFAFGIVKWSSRIVVSK